MSRVAIVGNGGGGKTTLAHLLAERYSLPLFEVDAVQFKPGLEREDPAAVAAWQTDAIKGDKWLIDGWGSWELIEERFAQADTIVFVDFPLWVHTWWALKRQVSSLFVPVGRSGGMSTCAHDWLDAADDLARSS